MPKFLSRILVVALSPLAFGGMAAAEGLTCEIDFYRGPNSGGDLIGVVGGFVSGVEDGQGSVHVTVTNGRATYTTLTDRNGRWNVAFKLLSNRLTAEVWTTVDSNNAVACSER